ncbi:MAG: protein-(glutamine-N5) methyltransferase, release factor-specific [Bacteroidetes bacterium]|nr:MAG: protein-(glutamine-N5) methyltransferase, release factor-specific [Bacteroidota bacterium]
MLGEADFYDLKFKVNKHTLIPRPETEELVHKIIADCNNLSPQILDIGTGSGCIPIALAKHIKNALISSIDISAEAIDIARQNAENNAVKVEFLHRDILNWQNYSWQHYDIIVSNPPYVCNSEKAQMNDNVLAYEPHSALFVEDDNPLIFYIAIADFAKKYLNDKGKIYLEINENLGQETLQMLSDKGFVNLQLLQDINGRDRMAVAEKNITR